jgi:hypothetical protein
LLIMCFWARQGFTEPMLVLTDLWDSPHSLESICKGRSTVFFICDTELSVCREGAVFFDSRADEIEAHGMRAALIFAAQPAEVRDFVLRTNIGRPVYVDSGGRVFGTLLSDKVLPALVLVDGDCRHVRTLYGGGESLEGNIATLLGDGERGNRRLWLVLFAVAVVAVLPLVLD